MNEQHPNDLLIDKTEADILAMIDAGEFDKEPGALAAMKAAHQSPLPLLQFLICWLAPHNFTPSWANFRHLPPPAAKRGRGRPPRPRGPSPITGPVLPAFQSLYHLLVRLPRNREIVAERSRIEGAANAARVQAACASIGGQPTASAVLDYLNDENPLDASTVNRHKRKVARVKQE